MRKYSPDGDKVALDSLPDDGCIRQTEPFSQGNLGQITGAAALFLAECTKETQNPIDQSVSHDFTVVFTVGKERVVHPVVDPIKADNVYFGAGKIVCSGPVVPNTFC